MSQRSWIEETFLKRDCVKFIPSSRDFHRCVPVCQICQNLIRCCCGRLIAEHNWKESPSPLTLSPGSEQDVDQDWSTELHTEASPTNAYGTIDFQDTATRVCRAKYVRVAVDSKADQVLQLMLKEWQMETPKLLLSVHGGLENFSLPPKVKQSFSRGLITAALSTGAWIFTDGINTGVSKYVGEAVKTFGSHKLRKRNTVGLTSWGLIDNNMDLIGRDVFRPYQPVGNPLSKRASLNRFHSHFLLVDDGTLGKYGCQHGLRRNLEKQIQLRRIHQRLNQGVPILCVVVEGGPSLVSTVLDYVSRVPPVPVLIFEGSGRAADLLAFLHKQTTNQRKLVSDIEQDFLLRISSVFNVDAAEASHLYSLLLKCMDHRQAITIFDSESEDQAAPDISILSATLKGTRASPAEQLSMTLAWNRADVAQKDVLVFGRHWQIGSLEQAMLDALLMDRVSFVKLLIDNGMTMSRFLTVERLENLYNMPQGQTDRFLRHLVEDVKQSSLPANYRLSLIDIGVVIEYLVGGAYRSTYTRKNFRAAYIRQLKNSTSSLSNQRRELTPNSSRSRNLQDLHFFRTAQPYRSKDLSQVGSTVVAHSSELHDEPLLVFPFNYNDLFVWAVLQQRQKMALFLWQHGEEALARATVACKLYRSMSIEAGQSGMDDNASERFKEYSLEFGQLAVDFLDCAFHQNEQMAMKLLTSEMEAWSHFTCLQMAVSSYHRTFVSHSCTQTLLTDLWTGPLDMRKNSVIKIILSLLLPPAVLLLEFKSKAEMCHVPQSHEVTLFSLDSVKSDQKDSEGGHASSLKGLSAGSEINTSTMTLCLSWIKRLYEFYTAPVVKFWFHTIFYLAFLMLFSFVILVKMEDHPSVQEWVVIAYIMSTAVEKVREVLMSEPRKLRHKLKIWFSDYWNISDFVAILLFLVGLVLRWYPLPYRTAGRLLYCLDIIFWFTRLTELLAVNQHAGLYLTMITKMTGNMFFIVVMMAIVLLSFGVSRKAILSPDEEPSWTLAKDVVFQPYWMIYGEVYAGEIDPCNNDAPCSPASFLTPFLQAVYMFFQYIIMVNILIAFFNNIYFDMASTSNKLWKYNRYRNIMTYQKRPWLPAPLVVFSHLSLAFTTIYRKLRRDTEAQEKYRDRRSGLKLHLCLEDRKKLHEFEEKCMYTYKHQEREGRDGGLKKRIKATAERSQEMSYMVGEVLEKVQMIQDDLLGLDCQLGQLQDLSGLVMDTATLLSASDCLHQEEARLAQCGSVSASYHVPPPQSRKFLHKTGLEFEELNPQKLKNWAFKSKSTPPSLLKGFHLGMSGVAAEEDSKEVKPADAEHSLKASPSGASSFSSRGPGVQHIFSLKDQSFPGSSGHLYSRSPLVSGHLELPYRKFWIGDPYQYHSQEETSVEEEEEEEEEGDLSEREEDEDNHKKESPEEQFPDMMSSRTSSHNVLLSNSGDISEGLVNPAFSLESSQPASLSSDQSEHHLKPRWNSMSGNQSYKWCRSLSSSVENMTFCAAAPLSPVRGSFPSLCKPTRGQRLSSGRSYSDISKSTEWPRSSDLGLDNKEKTSSKKTVKIQEEHRHDDENQRLDSSNACWRRWRWCRGEPTCWSASTSLSQLNFDPVDMLQKQMISPQDMWSPTHSAWNSWARSMSRRSSLQNFINPEVKSSSFSSMDTLFPHYSAMERNNLMRLALSIPFTPVSLFGGEEVSVYTLQDSSASTLPPCWSTQGMSALLQPLSSEEGSLDGGLRLGCRVLCTWAENDVLKTGLLYVVKAFKPEVVRVWQRYYPGDTALQLCLREIQQQKAAQRLMNIFNQTKPSEVQHTPRFLDVCLIQWHSSGQWCTIERNMTGHFRKYNNNTGEEIAPCCTLEETLLAFSHWTYQFSNRELLVLDLQGVGEELTDPTVVMAENQSGNRNELPFGADNLGDAAIRSFLRNHCCNSCCHLLGLTERPMDSDDTSDNASSGISHGQSSESEEDEEEEG